MGVALPSPDYGTTLPTSSGFALSGVLLIFFVLVLLFMLAYLVVIYVFQGIAIMKMHEKLGLKGGWMAFIPVLSSYAIGKVAEQYIKAEGKKSARFSVILLILNIFSLCMGIFLTIIPIIAAVFLPGAPLAILELLITGFSMIISCGISIVTYVALWRIFKIFSTNATLFLVLSIFLPIQPFLLFAVRNNQPTNVFENTQPVIEAEVVSQETSV